MLNLNFILFNKRDTRFDDFFVIYLETHVRKFLENSLFVCVCKVMLNNNLSILLQVYIGLDNFVQIATVWRLESVSV